MLDRLTGLRIDHMRNASAVQFIIVAIAAGGADAVPLKIDQRLRGVFLVGGFLNRHPPGFAADVGAARQHRAAHRHQIVGDPLLLHQPRQMIGGEALAHGGEIDIQPW